jgi:hypothetical protein
MARTTRFTAEARGTALMGTMRFYSEIVDAGGAALKGGMRFYGKIVDAGNAFAPSQALSFGSMLILEYMLK